MTENHIVVATYNVSHICKSPSNEATSRVIATCGADVQEINRDWGNLLETTARYLEKYPFSYFHNESYNPWAGFACLSKFPIDCVQTIKETERGWYPAGRIMLKLPNNRDLHENYSNNDDILQILVVHLRAPVLFTHERNWYGVHADWVGGYFSKDVKAKRLDEIKTFFRQLLTDVPTIIVGDFNERPNGACIRYLERMSFMNVPKIGWNTSTWSFGLCGVPLLSFEYDYIFHSKDLQLLDSGGARIGSCGGSDHRIVIASFARVRNVTE